MYVCGVIIVMYFSVKRTVTVFVYITCMCVVLLLLCIFRVKQSQSSLVFVFVFVYFEELVSNCVYMILKCHVVDLTFILTRYEGA